MLFSPDVGRVQTWLMPTESVSYIGHLTATQGLLGVGQQLFRPLDLGRGSVPILASEVAGLLAGGRPDTA
ncbi:hypothetical protein DPM13_09530 [Paracoccus mutanolyticus]|uniref:Uncharacterized protein n=1 Tax=Paracoccus mutanolyticus TaxID=1499308 RepID=A0ABM6WRS2_9RHOB|nr:hypothetical protein DPM13_09530 [Paracoccus mutanolyticus]